MERRDGRTKGTFPSFYKKNEFSGEQSPVIRRTHQNLQKTKLMNPLGSAKLGT